MKLFVTWIKVFERNCEAFSWTKLLKTFHKQSFCWAFINRVFKMLEAFKTCWVSSLKCFMLKEKRIRFVDSTDIYILNIVPSICPFSCHFKYHFHSIKVLCAWHPKHFTIFFLSTISTCHPLSHNMYSSKYQRWSNKAYANKQHVPNLSEMGEIHFRIKYRKLSLNVMSINVLVDIPASPQNKQQLQIVNQ